MIASPARAHASGGRRQGLSGFSRLSLEGWRFWLADELAPCAGELLVGLRQAQRSPAHGLGGRQSAFPVQAGGSALFLRLCRRGGLMRLLADDIYLGVAPRPLAELRTMVEAARRGLAVTQPMGAAVKWLLPGLYRGLFLTRALAGMTLWDFIRTDDDPRVRAHVLAEARRTIDEIHQAGLFHADLNLCNLFVARNGERLSVVVLDLDKARFYPRPLGPALRRANLRRLLRSARRLDPGERFLDRRALELLGAS
jgi:hypothetical protein